MSPNFMRLFYIQLFAALSVCHILPTTIHADDQEIQKLQEQTSSSPELSIKRGRRNNTLWTFEVSGENGDDGKDGVSYRGQTASHGSSGFFWK